MVPEKFFVLSIVSLLVSFVVLIVFFLRSHINSREIILQREQIHRLEIKSLETDKLKSIASAEEEQMRRIGRYLHDEIGGHLHVLLNLLEQPNPDPENNHNFQRAASITRMCIHSVRLTSQELVPYFLLNFGLQRTLQTLIEDSNDIHGLNARYTDALQWPLELVPQSTSIQLYRLIQEVFSNLIRHAKPRDLLFHIETQTGKLFIQFTHNGVGISQQEFNHLNVTGKSIGLKNILYRKELLNAEVYYERNVEQSHIRITLPIEVNGK